MARQVLPIVGAVIGAYFGGPQGAQIGFAIGSLVGNAVDPLKVAGPKLGEGSGQTAAEGVYRPVVLGTAPVGGNIIHRGPEIIRKQRDRAGKGGGPITITERRYRTFAIRVAEGPIAGVLRIWMDEKLVYDTRPESVIPADTLEFSQRFRLYAGDENQLPDPALEAYLGIGNVNSYRGTAYVVFENFDLTDYGDRIPQFRFEVVGSGLSVPGTAALALRSDDPDTPFTAFALTSPEGVSWSGNWETQLNLRNNGLFATRERFISYNTHQVPSWLEPGDTQWNVGTGAPMGGFFGEFPAAMDDTGQVILIPNGLGRPLRSQDGGKSWSEVANVHWSDAMCHIGARFVSFYQGDIYVSGNNGDSFGLVASVGMSSAIRLCRWSGAGRIMFGGSTSTIPRSPKMVQSTNGLLFSEVGLPEFSPEASAINVVCSGLVDGEESETWVCMTNTGEIAYRNPVNGLWSLSPDVMGCTPLGLAHDGKVFIAIGGVNADGEDGVIKTSPDGMAWTTRRSENLSANEQWWRVACLVISAGTVISEKIPLSSIVSWAHERIGGKPYTYNVSELTDLVDGIVFSDGYTAADAIRTLMPIYMFDAVECSAGAGYRINYVKRGKPVQAVLTIDDLVDEPEESVREDALERPRVLHLHFQNPTIGYAPAKASPRRNSPDVEVVGEVTTSVPVVFSDVDEAWRRADVLLRVAWAEVSGKQELTISDNHLSLVPTDCIGLSLRGQVRRLRMTKQEVSGGTLKTEWMVDHQSSYTSNLTGIPLPEPEPPPPSISGPTASIFGDWPALSDNHDALVSYAAASGVSEAWWGAVYQRSLNSGATYSTVATFDSLNSIMGVLVNDVAPASSNYTDTTNTVRVALYTDDEVESISQQEFLSEGGAFALSWMDGDKRRWEIMQYRDAEQDSNGFWTLTTLQRGRLETQAAGHSEGDIFVLLDNAIQVLPMQSSWLGMDLTHRAVSNGRSPELSLSYTDEFTGESQKEWPVANLFVSRSGDKLLLSCVPRHRFGTDDAPVQSINHDGYRWSASDGANSLSEDTVSTDHSFDVVGWSTPITVTVAQLNRITGPGPTVSEEIE